jgi:hypothetical protein
VEHGRREVRRQTLKPIEVIPPQRYIERNDVFDFVAMNCPVPYRGTSRRKTMKECLLPFGHGAHEEDAAQRWE